MRYNKVHAERKYAMIKHIVMYTLREDCNKQAAIEEIRQALESLVGVVPGLIRMQIRPTLGGEFDYVLYSVFENSDALNNYKTHPAHLAVKPIVHGYIASRVAADFIGE